ncbi:response regulator transcription factor [Streptomyces tubercidicus]
MCWAGGWTSTRYPGGGPRCRQRSCCGCPRTPAPDPLTALGERELQVLARLALGHRNRAIAQELHISESTVKFHVAKILTKPGVESRGRGGGTLPRRGVAVAAVVPGADRPATRSATPTGAARRTVRPGSRRPGGVGWRSSRP